MGILYSIEYKTLLLIECFHIILLNYYEFSVLFILALLMKTYYYKEAKRSKIMILY